MCKLVGCLKPKSDHILEHLFSQNAISEETYNRLLTEDNQREQTRSLLCVLSRTDPHAFGCFLAIMKEKDDLYEGIHTFIMNIHENITEGKFREQSWASDGHKVRD